MTGISDKNSVQQNWQVALQNDGVVSKAEADRIIVAARDGFVSGRESQQARDILSSVRNKARSIMEANRAANEAGARNDPRAPMMRAEVQEASERQRQNMEASEHLSSTLTREHSNQNIFQNFWSWLFSK